MKLENSLCINMLQQGKDGESAPNLYYMDLSNELDGFIVDDLNHIKYDNTFVSTEVAVYDGKELYDISGYIDFFEFSGDENITHSILSVNEVADGSTGVSQNPTPTGKVKITFNIAKDVAFYSRQILIKLTLPRKEDITQNVELTATFNIKPVKEGADGKAIVYKIEPDPSQLTIDSEGYFVEDKIDCSQYKVENGYRTISEQKLMYSTDRGEEHPFPDGGIVLTRETLIFRSLIFYLYDNETNELLDMETIPVLFDGKDAKYLDFDLNYNSIAIRYEGSEKIQEPKDIMPTKFYRTSKGNQMTDDGYLCVRQLDKDGAVLDEEPLEYKKVAKDESFSANATYAIKLNPVAINGYTDEGKVIPDSALGEVIDGNFTAWVFYNRE